MAKVTTRAETAALYNIILPVKSSSPSQLKAVYEKSSSSDPFSIAAQPCHSDVEKAQKRLSDEVAADKNPTGIEIQGHRQFLEKALSVLKRFCKIAELSRKVTAEADWLLQMKFSPRDLVQLQDVLWHHPACYPILRHGKKAIDQILFLILLGSKYIDSFVIDINFASVRF